MTCGIYKIENIINKKVYIGQSTRCEYRMNRHRALLNSKKHQNKYLQNSWEKYKEESFLFKLIVKCKTDSLDNIEKKLIKEARKNNLCYNLESGGHKLKKHSESTKNKISKALLGKKIKDTSNMGKSRIGKKLSIETRKKLIKNHKGFTGKNHSKKSKKIISSSLKGHIVSIETRNKISRKLKGKMSEENKKKVYNNLKGYVFTEKDKKKISDSKRGKPLSEKHKANLSKSHMKLNEKQIEELVSLRKNGYKYKEIATIFKISSASVYNYIKRVFNE